MESVLFRVGKKKFVITRKSILRAMKDYDKHHRRTPSDSGRRYATKFKGKLYPPKWVLSLAINKPRSSFFGGEATNSVHRNLGFGIRLVKGSNEATKNDFAKINVPIPNIQDLINRMFSQRWTSLHDNYARLKDSEYPGVYILTYSNKNLEGKPIREGQVFYVGMSHAGIKKRLSQFVRGIEDGDYHSGAIRFYKEYASEVPYSKLRKRKKFYVASVSVPCIIDKDKRTPMDLKKMGEVARLEWYIIAHIKEKLRIEPELNKK